MPYRFADSLRAGSRRNCPKYVELYSKNKFEKSMHLVGFIIKRTVQLVGSCNTPLNLLSYTQNKLSHCFIKHDALNMWGAVSLTPRILKCGCRLVVKFILQWFLYGGKVLSIQHVWGWVRPRLHLTAISNSKILSLRRYRFPIDPDPTIQLLSRQNWEKERDFERRYSLTAA